MAQYVFDTSAFLTLTKKELGKEDVKKILRNKRNLIFVSFITWTELYYCLKPYKSKEMQDVYAMIESLSIKTVWSDKNLCNIAGMIKAENSLSLADAFIAATAKIHDAILVHKDPEYEQLKDIKQKILPYKKK